MRSEQHDTAHLEWTADDAGGWTLRSAFAVEAQLCPGPKSWIAVVGPRAWTLARVGFHRPRVVVRPVGSLAEVAHAQADWRGLYAVRFVSGPTWEIDPSHSGGTVVRAERGAEIARLAWNGRFDAPGARVTLDAAADTRFAPLANLLAGYLFLDGLQDPTRRVSFGVPLGLNARTR